MLSGRNLTWNFTTLFSKQTSEISSVIGQPVVVTSSAGSTGYQLVAGKKIGQLYGYLMLHSVNELDPNGNPYIAKADQGNFTVASNGWVVYKDVLQMQNSHMLHPAYTALVILIQNLICLSSTISPIRE